MFDEPVSSPSHNIAFHVEDDYHCHKPQVSHRLNSYGSGKAKYAQKSGLSRMKMLGQFKKQNSLKVIKNCVSKKLDFARKSHHAAWELVSTPCVMNDKKGNALSESVYHSHGSQTKQ